MALIVFFTINSLETFLLAYFLYNQGSLSSLALGTHLSASRIALVGLTALIGMAFLLLAVRAFSKSNDWTKKFADFVKGGKSFYILVFFSLMILAALFLALSSPPEIFNSYQMIFLRLEPILAWLIVIIAQGLFWMLSFYVTVAVLPSHDDTRLLADMDLPSLIFLGLVLVKLVFVTATAYGPVVGDELEYFDIAFYLNQGNLYYLDDAFHYPLMYGVSLLPALAFGQHTFTAIKIINIILSSSAVFPIYFLTRLFVDRKKAAAVTLLCCLLPFHLVFPRRIQSENLYYPLFFWSVLFIFSNPRDRRHTTPWDILSGLGLGVMFLTRYITLAALPAFFTGWWLKNISGTSKTPSSWLRHFPRFFLLAGSAFLAFSPWLKMGLARGAPLAELVGFGIAADTGTSTHLTFQNLLIWAVLYACYYIFMTAPTLPLLIRTVTSGLRRGADPLLKRWVFLVGLLAAAYGAAVVRHSWRASYNEQIISKIMGRYVTFLAPLFLLTSFIVLTNEKQSKPDRPAWIYARYITAIALVLFAYLAFMVNVIFPTDGTLLKAYGSIDGYYAALLGPAFLPIIALIYLVLALAQLRGWRKTWLAAAVLTAFYSFIALPTYYRELAQDQVYSLGGQQIAEAIIVDIGPENLSAIVNLHLPNSNASRDNNRIAMSASIRGFTAFFPTTYQVEDPLNLKDLEGYILLPQNLVQSTDGKLISTLEINGDPFALVKTDQPGQ